MSAEDVIKPFLAVWLCDNSKTENFEEFLAEMGVNFMIRKLAKRSSPKMTISVDDGKIAFQIEAGFTTRISTLPLDGTEIEEDQQGGGKSKSSFAVKDNKLVMTALPIDQKLKKTVVTREIVNGELVQLIDVADGKVVCKRVFKKQVTPS